MIEQIRFVAIEGVDGTGKATQSELTQSWLANELGKDVLKLSFPQYGQSSAIYVERYLNGHYGQADDVPADLATLAFALDRFAAKGDIERHLSRPNSFIIADRYVASNLAHQGTKFKNEQERQEFYSRTMNTEYGIFGIPKPDINIVLLLPTVIAQANVDKKATRSYTDRQRDIHEADASHLDRAKANYEELSRIYPDEFIALECLDQMGNMLSREQIQAAIRQILTKKGLV